MSHTRLPWKVDGDDIWHFGVDYDDADDPHRYTGIQIDRKLRESPIAHANLALIVRAVNAHDALKAYAECEEAFSFGDECESVFEKHGYRGLEVDGLMVEWIAKFRRAALALANGDAK